MIHAYKTVDRNNVIGLWKFFVGMHIYCGAWNNMFDGHTTYECSEDVAQNLIDGDTVSDAWIGGVQDRYVDNHHNGGQSECISTKIGGVESDMYFRMHWVQPRTM